MRLTDGISGPPWKLLVLKKRVVEESLRRWVTRPDDGVFHTNLYPDGLSGDEDELRRSLPFPEDQKIAEDKRPVPRSPI